MRVVVVVASLTACFSKPPPPTGMSGDGGRDDATTADGSPKDAPVSCVNWGPFGAPMKITVTPIAATGAQHVTISNDGLELLYDLQGEFYESLRGSLVQTFTTSSPVPGFGGLSSDEGAWLSVDRLRLFYIDAGTLIETQPRATTGDSFVVPGVNVAPTVDDATVTNDRLRVVYSLNNSLHLIKFASADDPASAMDGPLLDDTATNVADTAPSLGDHGKKLVFTKTDLIQSTSSVLYEADFDGSKLTNIHDLMLDDGHYDTDANLSDDGATLYFTSTRDDSDPTPQLYRATRSCS